MSKYTSGNYTLTGVAIPVTAEASANQTVTYGIVGLVDAFNIQSDAGATTTVNQSVSVADTLNLLAAGGTIAIGTGVAGVDTVNTTITNGGGLVVGGTLANALGGGSVTYGAGGGTITLGTAGTFLNLSLESDAISGFTSTADIIDDRALSFSAITGYSVTGTGTGTQTITVTDSSGNLTFETNDANLTDAAYASANLDTGTLKFSADSTGGTLVTVCFLRGTRITTPDGATAIEDLRSGDLVVTRRAGATLFQPVRWIGSGRMSKTLQMEDFPVRIRAGAFHDNIPHRDLLVTSEHCLFVEGKLVPARMLVNGRSIYIDTSIGDYEYFHVELDVHAILLAEGLEAESYLDTGNRGNFLNTVVSSLQPDFAVSPAHKSWALDAAAPLAVDRETVEPIWKTLEARATMLGFAATKTQLRLVDEPDLHLLTESGLEIGPTLLEGGLYTFIVPGNVGLVRLMSRTARPSETIGPFLDDRRELGVKVGRVGVGEGCGRLMSDLHLTSPTLPGWHVMEDQAVCRWTNGNAVLPVNLSWSEDRPVFLEIEVVSAGPYLSSALAA